MRRWLLLATLALPLTGGCKSISHPVEKSREVKEAEREAEARKVHTPIGEDPPFGPPPS